MAEPIAQDKPSYIIRLDRWIPSIKATKPIWFRVDSISMLQDDGDLRLIFTVNHLYGIPVTQTVDEIFDAMLAAEPLPSP